ncbi:hypothetical protein KIP88_22430 [Bradyrhizobium sp. SRL28]|uniref:hypothetical protein n=1 Tax=Bradyrhizobium sp. SRL28 TaxID=2836178 RepID=UPI001BDE5229|nr:hypothetical protein [Bradyrhizobium sp. SRL28]MBT1513254.1 hypothetical protein [Bradyrhizobium sp. SRL28]
MARQIFLLLLCLIDGFALIAYEAAMRAANITGETGTLNGQAEAIEIMLDDGFDGG